MWKSIESAPFEIDLELAVADDEGLHALVFPCQRCIGGWQDRMGVPVPVSPTHWRLWTAATVDAAGDAIE